MSKASIDAAHKAFEKHIKETFGELGMFTEHTLHRTDADGYTNMSVSMEWVIWIRAWTDACNWRHEYASSIRRGSR